MSEKILTQHPDPAKQGVNISQRTYDLVHAEIETILKREDKMKPMALFEAVGRELSEQIEGSAQWFSVTVKLDMEARGLITHDRKKGLLWLSTD